MSSAIEHSLSPKYPSYGGPVEMFEEVVAVGEERRCAPTVEEEYGIPIGKKAPAEQVDES